ncbi:MAG TPA: SEC-C metal-binding domain-containing protein [Bryobacteraceae bacterium]
MLFPSESVIRRRAEIARQCQSGEITEMDAGAQLIEADPDYGGGYLLLANARSTAGNLDEAESLYWKALERMPCDYKPHMSLPDVRRIKLPGDPLSERLMVLGLWKLALSREIPDQVGAFFRDKLPNTDFDFRDPATFEALAIAAGEAKGVPPEIRDRLLPYELLNDLQHESSGVMDTGLVRDILTHSERCIPVWRAALREWARDESVLLPDALGLLIALLGEMAGPEILDDLLDLADSGERPIFLHANWAIWRLGQRFSTEALAQFRNAAAGARLTLRCALAEQIHLLPETPEMEAVLIELLGGFHDLAGKEDAPYLLTTVIHALEELGLDQQAGQAFQEFQPLLPEAARKWVRDVLDESFVPRLVHEEIGGVTIEEICCDRILMEDEEDLSGEEELDEEEFEEITPVVAPPKPGRNEPCWCGSGKKYKKCHLASDEQEERSARASEPKTTAEPLDARLQRELIRAVERSDPAEYAEAHMLYFGRPPEEQNSNNQDDSRGGFIEWYIHDFRPQATGRTVVEEYLRKRAGKLTAAEREKLESWRKAQFGIWEVQRVEKGKGVELKNLFEDKRFFLYDVSSSRSLVRWDCVLSRVHQFKEKWYFVGNGITAPRSALAQLIGKIEQESKDAGQTPAAFVRSNSHRWHRVVQEMAAQRLADLRVVNAEGDELEFCSALYRIEDEASLIARLEAATPFEADQSNDPAVRAFAWLEQGVVEGPRRSYGRIEIRDGKLRLECNSRKRLAIGRQLVEKHGYGVIQHLGDTFQLLEALKRESLAEKPRTKAADASIPPEVEREVILKVKTEHYTRWVDEPLPALGGRTPREAARSEVGRRQLEGLLRFMENAEERSRQQGRAAFDFAALRKTLDL